MNTKKIGKILDLFQGRNIVQVCNDKKDIDTINIARIVGRGDNEVLYLAWEDEGQDYCIKFNEDGLNNAKIKDGNLVMEDIEGNEIMLAFYSRKQHALSESDLNGGKN